MTRPYAMTESDRTLAAMALRAKAEGDSARATELADQPTLKDQFERQAAQAAELAERIEEADLIDVWPNTGDDD